jgi:hypothetical protein
LVLDEPTERDQVEEVGGLQFVLDNEMASRLADYLPLQVDYDERFWFGVRVKPSRQGSCC